MTHSCELENFSSQVLEDSCNVDCSFCADAHLVLGVVLQETLDTTAGKLDELLVSMVKIRQSTRIPKHKKGDPKSRFSADEKICLAYACLELVDIWGASEHICSTRFRGVNNEVADANT